MHISIAFFLSLAEILFHESEKKNRATDLQGYRYVFWFEVAIAAGALLIMLAFVRLDRAKSDLTADEKELYRQREAEAAAELEHRHDQLDEPKFVIPPAGNYDMLRAPQKQENQQYTRPILPEKPEPVARLPQNGNLVH
jgi:hypothetical protein